MSYQDTQRLISPAPEEQAFYGHSVACSADGSTVIVGAYFEAVSGYADHGAVYIYTGSNYGTVTKLLPDVISGNYFGLSVACSADANVLAVSSLDQTLYIFSGTNYGTLTKKTLSVTGQRYDRVAVSADGTVVAASDHNRTGGGAVEVYSGSNWGTRTTITASDRASGDFFGWALALSENGSTLVVGAPLEDTSGTTNNGAVYVYNGSNWGTQTKLLASDRASFDELGRSVACSADGSIVFAGAPDDSTGSDLYHGALYIFSGTGYATQKKRVPATLAGDHLGVAGNNSDHGIACTPDGSIVVVGASGYDDGTGELGGVFVFDGDDWNDQDVYTPTDPHQQVGSSLACSETGELIVAGAWTAEVGAVENAGAVFIFEAGGGDGWGVLLS